MTGTEIRRRIGAWLDTPTAYERWAWGKLAARRAERLANARHLEERRRRWGRRACDLIVVGCLLGMLAIALGMLRGDLERPAPRPVPSSPAPAGDTVAV